MAANSPLGPRFARENAPDSGDRKWSLPDSSRIVGDRETGFTQPATTYGTISRLQSGNAQPTSAGSYTPQTAALTAAPDSCREIPPRNHVSTDAKRQSRYSRPRPGRIVAHPKNGRLRSRK